MDSQPPTSTTIDACEAELNRATKYNKDNGVVSNIPSIIRSLLVESSRTRALAAQVAAQKVDSDYRDLYLPSDPLMKGEEDKGMATFLTQLHELLLALAQHLDYDDDRQDALVQLLVELGKLPPEQFRIWGEDCLIYKDDPILASVCEDSWNAQAPVATNGLDNDSGLVDFEDSCKKWINLSTFLVRCTGAGIFDKYTDLHKYPSVDIRLGLEESSVDGALGNARLMVALKWILHAGRGIHDDMVKHGQEGWNVERWRLWATKLQEIEAERILEERVKSTLQRALATMKEVDASISF